MQLFFQYKNSFRKRTLLYFFIGIFCASLDFWLFINISSKLNIFFSNLISYSSGSLCSFLLNKKFTFKSYNSELSFFRYAIVILVGFLVSQFVLYLGINLFGLINHLSTIKFVAMLACVSIQYFGNTMFGSKKCIKKI